MANVNRRKFLLQSAISTAGIVLGSTLEDCTGVMARQTAARKTFDLMEQVRRYRKLDSHAHLWEASPAAAAKLIGFADRLHIDKLIISAPVTRGAATPQEFRQANDLILQAMKKFPDRFIGQLTLNPSYPRQALEELNRCVSQGMVGVKVYNQVKIHSPLFYPIIEKLIDLKMILLMHVGIGKARIRYDKREPASVSIPEDFVAIARRYPEAMFQFAHLAGGIDWEDGIKALQHTPNVYVDTSGSNNEAGIMDLALQYLGEDRLLFGCDNSFYQGVGHVLASNLSESQKRKVFFENYNNILKKAGRHVG